jgi:hypothetical protein
MLGTTKAELIRTIVKASTRDWMRVLRRELKKQREIFDEED